MATKVRGLCIAAVIAGTMWLAGCDHYNCAVTFGNSTCGSSGSSSISSGGAGSFSQTAFVYFVDPSAGQMAAEGMDVNDSQTFVALSSFVTPTLPMKEGGTIAIVSKQYLYMQFLNGTLYGFVIDKTTGALTPISNASPFPSAGSTLVADPKGRYLFVGDGSGITMLAVNSTDGSLTSMGTFSTGGMVPSQMTTDGTGSYLYALNGAEILGYSYTSGVLVPVSNSPFTASSNTQFGVFQLVPDYTGAFMFGITQEDGIAGVKDAHIYIFGINNGSLTPVSGSPFATTNPPAYIAASPVATNIYVFTADYTSSSTIALDPIEGYSYSTTGQLTAVSGSPFSTILASSAQFDQSGAYLFTIGQLTNAASAGMFPIIVGTSGSLTPTTDSLGAASTIFAVTDEP